MIKFLQTFVKGFKKRHQQPEDDYTIIVTDELVRVEHPKWEFGSVKWKDVHTVMLINTDRGPWQPDVWLTLIDNDSKCMIPQGARGYEEVYEIVSKYDGFNFENVTKSMSCSDNVDFLLWQKESTPLQPNETLITGKWINTVEMMVGDYNCKRIEWLTNHYLILTETRDAGWTKIYQDRTDQRYWAKTFPQGELQGGGPPQLRCVGDNPTQLYKGMTVNERLYVSGLMDSFETAIKQNDVATVISILKAVE